jgi:hypothetical protein
LQIAVKILVARATKGCLHESLCARVDLARLLPVLAPFALRRGRPQAARRLLDALLLDVTGA